MQCQTYGLSLWVPYYGTGVVSDDPYVMRSDMASFFLMSWDMRRKDLDYDRLRSLMSEWRKIAKYYSGDYYPLTTHSLDDSVWMAWQFDRPDLNAGMIQVFRRAESPYETAKFRMKGLEPDAKYVVSEASGGETATATGRELMEQGLAVTMKDRPSACAYVYAKP